MGARIGALRISRPLGEGILSTFIDSPVFYVESHCHVVAFQYL